MLTHCFPSSGIQISVEPLHQDTVNNGRKESIQSRERKESLELALCLCINSRPSSRGRQTPASLQLTFFTMPSLSLKLYTQWIRAHCLRYSLVSSYYCTLWMSKQMCYCISRSINREINLFELYCHIMSIIMRLYRNGLLWEFQYFIYVSKQIVKSVRNKCT